MPPWGAACAPEVAERFSETSTLADDRGMDPFREAAADGSRDPDEGRVRDGGDPPPSAGPSTSWPPRLDPCVERSEAAEAYLGPVLEVSVVADAAPPPEPVFAPGRLQGTDAWRHAQAATPGAGPRIVPFDPRNPSGRTRGDAVLHPNDSDRRRRVWLRRRRAATAGATAAVFVMVVLGHGPVALYVAAAVLGAVGGAIANETSDTSWSWAPCLSLACSPVGLAQGTLGLLLMSAALAGAGWLIGLLRESDV